MERIDLVISSASSVDVDCATGARGIASTIPARDRYVLKLCPRQFRYLMQLVDDQSMGVLIPLTLLPVADFAFDRMAYVIERSVEDKIAYTLGQSPVTVCYYDIAVYAASKGGSARDCMKVSLNEANKSESWFWSEQIVGRSPAAEVRRASEKSETAMAVLQMEALELQEAERRYLLSAVLGHEVAHMALGHLKPESASLSDEIAADTFALKHLPTNGDLLSASLRINSFVVISEYLDLESGYVSSLKTPTEGDFEPSGRLKRRLLDFSGYPEKLERAIPSSMRKLWRETITRYMGAAK
jgi:hypothetical protein